MALKKRGLGKGLDALLSASGNPAVLVDDVLNASDLLQELPLENIQRGRYQPRKEIDQEALNHLSESIKRQGLMQPIIVRPIGERYEIIAGERRWRACKLIGNNTIAALVRDVDDEAAIAMALIENLQREDLNPMEEAEALHRLQKEFDLTQSGVAEAVGKPRSTVANLLRLISLQPAVKSLLEAGEIEMGHARAILALNSKQQEVAANTVLEKSLSVRQTERLVKDLIAPPKEVFKDSSQKNPDVTRLEIDLSEKLGAKVEITFNRSGRGKLQISYNNLDELQGILSHLK